MDPLHTKLRELDIRLDESFEKECLIFQEALSIRPRFQPWIRNTQCQTNLNSGSLKIALSDSSRIKSGSEGVLIY